MTDLLLRIEIRLIGHDSTKPDIPSELYFAHKERMYKCLYIYPSELSVAHRERIHIHCCVDILSFLLNDALFRLIMKIVTLVGCADPVPEVWCIPSELCAVTLLNCTIRQIVHYVQK